MHLALNMAKMAKGVRGSLLMVIMVLAISYKNTYHGVTLGLVTSYA